jgi:hypothetical protein
LLPKRAHAGSVAAPALNHLVTYDAERAAQTIATHLFRRISRNGLTHIAEKRYRLSEQNARQIIPDAFFASANRRPPGRKMLQSH